MKNHNRTILIALVTLGATFTAPLVRGEEPARPKVKPYTLETCIVSDGKPGEMGKPVVFTYKEQEIKICCKGCRKGFDKDPDKYHKKLEPKK